jgi:hypothetical protein
MIWIRSNGWGLVLFVLGGVIAGVESFILKIADAPVLMSVGLALMVGDLIIRTRSTARLRSQPGWLWARQAGGHLFFVPMWVLGVIVFVANLAKGLGA